MIGLPENRLRWAAQVVALSFILFLNGAIPGLFHPDYYVSYYFVGFAQSIANQDLLSIYSDNFGYPTPMPVAFGLPQTYLIAVLIKLGLAVETSYVTIVSGFLALAFYGFIDLCRIYRIDPWHAMLAATLWLSLPVISRHQGFGMLIVGLAMIPAYLAVAARLAAAVLEKRPFLSCFGLHVATAVLAVFTDGYSFVMYAVASSAMLLADSISDASARWKSTSLLFALHLLALAVAYFLYTSYIGRANYEYPIYGFRYFGSAIGYLVRPTTGISFLADLAGLGLGRNGQTHFGDPTVWRVSWSLPVLVLGLLAISAAPFVKTKAKIFSFCAFLAIMIFGFFMALGPTAKLEPLWSEVPPGIDRFSPGLWLESYLFNTGSWLISSHIPGFSAMRAAYRWVALGSLGAIMIFLLAVSTERRRALGATLVVFALLCYLPNLKHGYTATLKAGLATFRQSMHNWQTDFDGVFEPNERVVFLPLANDFFLSYLAAHYDVRAFNVSGDKNIEIARRAWPAHYPPHFTSAIDKTAFTLKSLLSYDVDAVVFSWFDNALAHWLYPCTAVSPGGLECDSHLMAQDAEALQELSSINGLSISRHERFGIIRRGDLAQLYPIEMDSANERVVDVVSEDGWWATEQNGRWSKGVASLQLPVPEGCLDSNCSFELEFTVFGASEARPVTVQLSATAEREPGFLREEAYTAPGPHRMRIPSGTPPTCRVEFRIPKAISPRSLHGVADKRNLGVFLWEIRLLVRTDTIRAN